MIKSTMMDFWSGLSRKKYAEKSAGGVISEGKSIIPAPVLEAIFSIADGITEIHRPYILDALRQSWLAGGLGIIIKHNGIRYHAQWITRTSSGGESPVHLGTAMVVLEDSRGVAIGG